MIGVADWGNLNNRQYLLVTDSRVAKSLILIFLLYILSTLIQSLLPFSISRVLGGLLIIILVLDLSVHLSQMKVLIACMGLLSLAAMPLFTTNDIEDIDYYIYLFTTLLMFALISRKIIIFKLCESVRSLSLSISLCIYFSAALVLILLLSGTGYEISWDGGQYFSGFAGGHHTMASAATLLMILTILDFKINQKSKWLTSSILLLLTYAILETGARTFLFPAALAWFVFINDNSVLEHRWQRIIMFLIAIAAFLAFFDSSAMSSKFDYVINFQGAGDRSFLANITSGRIEYWETDLDSFFEQGIFRQLVGNSASFVYDLNEAVFFDRIWAHNDFVMILCSSGYLGLVAYVISLGAFFYSISSVVQSWRLLLLELYVLLPAFINGFYGYQHLVYSFVLFVCVCFLENSSTLTCIQILGNGVGED